MTPNIQSLRKEYVPSTPVKTKKRPKTKRRSSVSSSDKENETLAYDPQSMDFELDAGMELLHRFISKSPHAKNDHNSVQDFRDLLVTRLRHYYEGHWYPETPEKGSAFRCLRVNQSGSESIIEKTAKDSGHKWVLDSLPKEFTLWIDPGEVSYRIGEDGSICVHFKENLCKRGTSTKQG